MAEVSQSGLIKEYIITIRADQSVSGKEPIATTAAQATETPTSTGTSEAKATPQAKGEKAKNEIEAHTIIYRAASVVMPYFNAKTNGQAATLFRRGYEIFGIVKAAMEGSKSMAWRSAAAFVASIATEAVQKLIEEQKDNNRLAASIDATSRLRASAGLSTVSYTRKGLLKKVVITNNR